MKSNEQRAFSVMEIIVVIAVLGLIASLVLAQFNKIRSTQVLNNSVATVLSSLHKARSQTSASINSSVYGVHFQSDQVILFTGTTYTAGTSSNESIAIISPATISSISLTGGASDLYFNRLSGAPSKTGTVTVTASSVSKIITIDATGNVSVN